MVVFRHLIWIAGLMLGLSACAAAAGAAKPQPNPAQVSELYSKQSLSFEVNQGQAGEPVKFLARAGGYTVLVNPTEAVFDLRRRNPSKQPAKHDFLLRKFRGPSKDDVIEHSVIRMKLAGANPTPRVIGTDELPGKVNYFIGNDPAKWRTNVSTYARVKCQDVYPGVDLVYYGSEGRMEYDFVVAPGADPNAIRLSFDGTDSLRVDEQGNLVLSKGSIEIRQLRPRVYQDLDGSRKELHSRFWINAAHEVAFRVDHYDTARALIIDPALSYSTFLGATDYAQAIAADPSGNVYVTGSTDASQTASGTLIAASILTGAVDIFVRKFSGDGNMLLFTTYIGGNDDDRGMAIAADNSGNVYVSGVTSSTDLPTKNGFQTTYGGGPRDAFLVKLNSAGNSLLYSTYLGGSNDEYCGSIAVDASGQVYIAGQTASANFPKTTGGFQQTLAGASDAFIAKLNTSASGISSLLYATYFGGSGDDAAFSIALDPVGNIYTTGSTDSPNLPVSPGTFQKALTNSSCPPSFGSPCSDAFVAKLNPSTTGAGALVYSTYLGGSLDQQGLAIAVDAAGDTFVGGATTSTDFPITAGAIQSTYRGADCDGYYCTCGFVTKVNPAGTALLYSTYFGGSGASSLLALTLDGSGNVYVGGQTNSSDFPTTVGTLQTLGGGYDAFVAELNPSGSQQAVPVSSTYLGGTADDWIFGIALNKPGKAYVAGNTQSPNFPVTSQAFNQAFRNCDGSELCQQAFLAAIDFSQDVIPGPHILLNGYVNAASFRPASVSPGDIVTIFGSGIGPAALAYLQLDSQGRVGTTLAQTQVLFDGVPAPLIYVTSGQLSAIVPYEVAGTQTAEVQVQYQGAPSNTLVLPVSQADLGIFAASASGAGQAAILNQDYSVNSPANPAGRNSVVQVFATGGGQTSPSGVNGQLTSSQLPLPLLPITAEIGGKPAPVGYAGAAPGLVAGVLQVNILIPADSPTGDAVPIRLIAGSSPVDTSQDNVTLAIK